MRKHLLKVYCCKEVKRFTHSFNTKTDLEQTMLFFIDCMYQFDYKQNAKSDVISVIVDEESTYHWLLNLIKNILKNRKYSISYVKR